MRSIGRFFGEVGRAVRSSPDGDAGSGGKPTEVRRTVETEQRETPQGRVTLRRTTIEEIEVDRSE